MKKLIVLTVFSVSVLLISTHGVPSGVSSALAGSPVLLAAPQQPAAATFTGTVVKSGETFKLNDADNKTSYMLDDTQRASQYEGKKVKVTGTLDSQTHMIHVQSIQAAA